MTVSWNDPGDPVAEVEQLKAALVTRPVIEQAKGMVMLSRTCTAEEAFAVLREISQHTQVTVRDVAAVIVAAGSRAQQSAEPGNLAQTTVAAVLQEARRYLPDLSPR
ncbi:ANTAR domain-containing protein [Amycolatopsis sp. lyj-23]|uniref:ANTAR domain-containing protein n=1 Tax=Amycolatopsis sp. lyj-23 TaxID=2789283 RepID=UPI00397D6CEB